MFAQLQSRAQRPGPGSRDSPGGTHPKGEQIGRWCSQIWWAGVPRGS